LRRAAKAARNVASCGPASTLGTDVDAVDTLMVMLLFGSHGQPLLGGAICSSAELSAYWKSRAAVRRCCVDGIDPWCGARFGLT
jgi:hypothetical protein